MRTFNLGSALVGFGLALVVAFGGTLAHAQNESARYRLYVGGIPAGELVFNARNNGKTYQVAGSVRSTGLVGAIVKVGYGAQVSGTIVGGKLQPSAYTEQASTGRRDQGSKLSYKNGVPQLLQATPPRKKREWDLEPSGQKGTLDPLSMIYTLLREVDQQDACSLNQRMFDGRRLTEVILGAPSVKDGLISCAGVYRRLGGFSPKDMAEKNEFRFSVTYAPTATGRYVVDRLSSESLYGKAVIKRR
ncbi:DUF3108 domain-containing protein [Falsihalocynthiibacter sp. SS001]|uniref:DUF3108 domain-containing protein n=1 Tax=Falsihalocynthiibacter sp. SS001 TaxID=3349698 RepID=UPI0036D3CD22